MILGIGIDMVNVSRIEQMLSGMNRERFLERVFTEQEIEYCLKHRNPAQFFAARFSAKEATLKAFGKGMWRGIGFKEISVGKEKSGKPYLIFTGRALEEARKMGVTHSHIAISHIESIAISIVILEG